MTPPRSDKRNGILVAGLGIVGVGNAGALVGLTDQWAAGVVIGGVALGFVGQGLRLLSVYRRRVEAAEPKPTDAHMDALLGDDIRDTADRALLALGITLDELALRSRDVDPLTKGGHRRLADQGRGPIPVFGPTPFTLGRIGHDGKWRFARYRIMVICPTGHNLGIYTCDLDSTTGHRLHERTDEYHYDDVVAVRTTTTTTPDIAIRVLDATAQNRVALGSPLHRQFQIIVSSGDRGSIIVGIEDEHESGQTVPLQESGIEAVIEAVRRILRVKKGGIAPSL
ncbi:hypothetical protein [Pseudonocardia zijingensis]|jgi:hypothetical protein|uniref:GAF domain-containing protein n=2 Tax=Pseudonocardia zijingensis TaxID=153376 RepID=A0ABP3ZYL3_9PSEU